MKKNSVNVVWRSLLFYSFVVSGISIFKCDRAFSQITPDNTLGDESSILNPRDEASDSIEGGAVRGQNLFHSFQEFNVGGGRGVYFANPDAVSNIFSRVTGSNPSNILGTLGVDGAANLYLVNPNGIVFGENSSLDVQGSFTATTAEGIEFSEGGLFNAVEPGESLLTISVPLGLQFGSSSGSIINRSFVQDETEEYVGLQVPSGENLSLVGGEVRFEAGEATASGGNINIGGLGAAGTVSLSDDGSLSFPDNVAKADINLTDEADVDVRGTGGGNINIDAGNLNIEAGNFNSSQIRAGITADSTSIEAQAGNVTINATGAVNLVDGSQIENSVEIGAIGNSGDIDVMTESLTLTNNASLDTRTSGVGNAGDIFIQAEEITFSNSTIFTEVSSDGGIGNAGNINVTTNSLLLQNGSSFLADTENRGDAGNILIEAEDFVVLEGLDEDNLRSQITSTVDTNNNLDVTGNAGNIELNTDSLIINDGGFISTDTSGEGNGGGIEINANYISFANEARVSSDVLGKGNGGNIIINTNILDVNNSNITNLVVGEGKGGNLTINASEFIVVSGERPKARDGVGSPGGFLVQVERDGKGQAGDININTNLLSISDGSKVQVATFGMGNAGNLNIMANSVEVFDTNESSRFSTGIFASVETESPYS